jgi:hypothetical protein
MLVARGKELYLKYQARKGAEEKKAAPPPAESSE